MFNGGSGKAGFAVTVKRVQTILLLLFLSVLATGLMQPGKALAEEGWGPGQDKWKFELGGYFPAIDTSLRVDAVESLGDDLDLEDKLGFSDDDAIWRIDGYWRFFRRHRLNFGYYGFNRDASVILDETIEIGDTPFGPGRVDSELNLGFYSIDYMYSYFQGEKWELSAGLGAYWIDFEFSIAGYLIVEGEPIIDDTESTDFNGPLPYLKLAFEYYITPKWLVIAKGGFFALEVGDVDGSLLNLGAKLEYQFTRTFGLGLGYDGFRIDVTFDDGDLKSDIEYKYHGIQLYGILRF